MGLHRVNGLTGLVSPVYTLYDCGSRFFSLSRLSLGRGANVGFSPPGSCCEWLARWIVLVIGPWRNRVNHPRGLPMADQQGNLGPDETRGNQGGRLEARPAEADFILPSADAAPTDESPTVISKTSPIQAGKPLVSSEALGQGLKGRSLAHFELLEPIGVGGMAAVIRARDKQLDRFVALKILPPEMAGDPENIRRFHQEARAAARLDHENIARVFFCGEDQRLHFIAFEFVEGDNLRVILERRGLLPVPEAVHYMLQVATGLAHASARGVVHRDIKPSNIIVTSTGRAKLVDMGLARSMEPHSD